MAIRFSKEFFIQRSFEVVWAIFRVSEYVRRIKIKDALEDRAVEYLIYKDEISLMSLEEIIRLAIHINEISKINGKVLLREINNLKLIVSKIYDKNGQNIFIRKSPEDAPSVEEIFKNSPILLSDFMGMFKTLPEFGNSDSEEKKEKSGNIKNKNEIDKSTGNNVDKRQSLAKSGNNKSLAMSGKIENLAESNNSITLPESGKVMIQKREGSYNLTSARERRFKILDIVKERNLCHINDILSKFSKISPRTIRYDIKKMVDKGILERVGSGGPNSFFRIKK